MALKALRTRMADWTAWLIPLARRVRDVSFAAILAACGDPLVVEGAPPEVAVESPLPIPSEPVQPERVAEPRPEPAQPAGPTEAELQAAREAAARAAFEAAFPNHGVTFHFLARVRARPHHEAPVVGYMRRGAKFRASERVPGVGCARGWFEVPGDGFVCRGEGFTIGSEPQEFEPSPTPPVLEDALPYTYAYTARADVAQFWRLPSDAELTEADEAFRAMREREERQAALAAAPPPVDAGGLPDAGVDASDDEEGEEPTVEPTVVEAEGEVEAPPPPGQGDEETGDEPAAEAAPDPSLVAMASGEVQIPDFVRLRMGRGFYVSIDGEERSGRQTFIRTVRGAYVRDGQLSPNEPPEHRGVVLGGRWQLPVAFVYRGGTRRLRRVGASARFRNDGTVERHTPMIAADVLDRNGRAYVVGRDGSIVRRSAVRMAERVERPAEVGADERWIDVDLSEQVLVAYEGDEPVFVTTVSTGREGYETPVGIFRVRSKHVSTTMDDLDAGEESYLIEDVPWTMYFEGNYALHAAFWHSGFGRVRSHGCVNLAPADARWIFQWSGPTLPASWHGVFAERDRPGTWIRIRE